MITSGTPTLVAAGKGTLMQLYYYMLYFTLRYSGGGRRDGGYIDYDREDYLGHSDYAL